MATDTAPTKTEAKPADSSKDTTPAKATTPTPAKAAAKPKPRAKTAAKPRAKTAAKSRTRSTAASSRSRTASKSRSRKPAAAPKARVATATATATPVAQAKALSGGQQIVAGVIDAQEKSVTAIVDYQTRAAELSQIPGVTTVAQAQAKLLRSVTHTYANAARALLK